MKTTKIIMIIMIFMSLYSCSKKEKRNPNFISPLNIDIPNDLSDDTEIFSFISYSENRINEISDDIEFIASEQSSLINKKQDSLTVTDQLSTIRKMIHFYSDCSELENTITEFDEHIKDFKSDKNINEKQQKELIAISNKFKHRAKVLKHKYPELYNK